MQGRKIGENTYVKWRETPVGTVFQGYVIRMETSVAFPNSPTVFIQTDAGAEIGLPTTARLVVALRSGNVIPGNYLRITYKGSEKVTKGKFANGHSENRLFEVEVFDELDKSSDPRYAQQQQTFNNFYAARGGAPAQAYQQVQQQGYASQHIPQPGYAPAPQYAPQPAPAPVPQYAPAPVPQPAPASQPVYQAAPVPQPVSTVQQVPTPSGFDI
jgi:hypothetical protein